MRKLISLFKSLPREVRLMIAMAGLGTPLGAIYVLKRFLFPGMSHFMVILIVGGVIAGLCLLGYLVSRILGRGSRKRQKKMAADLASAEGAGPVAMDVRASIKANNEKFFSAIRDMRKNIGLSVYDLPWYIVIGDSGCGKTKLVNEGGLTFSTGKPEGYQLGTLNYNWWFTEDAIFVDMAGRLCNPQDDADRREWQAFLSTIGKGRKGFPINGAVVCVSAEHLLQDSPEKIEQDANTTLERLRDLQTRLGVTFATYLVITKCDKILGFMQFFDRAERDITFKNQIFGWSKPGDFNELYDPELFVLDFDRMYARLHELRLRRLQDEVDEIDLGMAYSFPEEFRELQAPVQTYVRTLFPMIRQPRAVKNLIFRGIYFTSATQEGSLILKHLTERLGSEAASQFAPLDLYPNKRPHFIKDLLFRKVFPEFGLVFRNEQQAVRNRKMARLLKWGSAALFVLLISLLGVSSCKFGAVIDQPRRDANDTQPAQERTPTDALKQAGLLGTDIGTLQANLGWATILSLGIGAGRPVDDLTIIRARLFEGELLREAIVDVSEALRSTKLVGPRGGPEAQRTGQAFMDALEQYVAWFGCAREDSPPEHMGLDNFEKLCAVVTDKEATMVAHAEQFFSQAADYFTALQEGEDWDNPARLLLERGLDPVGTIGEALQTAHQYLAGYAALDADHPDPVIREWMRIADQCVAIQSNYAKMLGAARDEPRTLTELEAFKNEFVAGFQTFAGSVDACTWQGVSQGVHTTIDPLRAALLRQRELWTGYQQRLTEACFACESPPDEAVGRAIASLAGGSDEARLPGLDRVFWDNLRRIELTERDYREAFFEGTAFAEVVVEVPDRYAHIIRLEFGGGTQSDLLLTTEHVGVVRGVLREIHDRLVALKLGPSADAQTPAQWIAKLEAYLEAEDPVGTLEIGPLPPVWRPDDLDYLYEAHVDLVERGGGQQLLETIYERLGEVGDWGFAQLAPGWNDKVQSVYQIDIPRLEEDRAAGREEAAEDDQPARRRRRPRRGRRSKGRRPREASKAPTVRLEGDRVIPACASRAFLSDRAEECGSLLYNLADFGPDYYFAGEDDVRPLNERCLRRLQGAGEAYMETYVSTWASAYQSKRLREVERLLERADDWKSLARLMQRRGEGRGAGQDEVADELQVALAEILQAVPYWSWYFDDESNEWTAAVDPDDADWLEVASWMQQAVERHWPQHLGTFAVEARLPLAELDRPDPKAPPWVALSNEFVRRWKALAKGMGAHATLPTKFDSDTAMSGPVKIPWNQIEALRREARIDDEQLTGQLVDFEHQAQQLLSAALTEVLCTVQLRYFRNVGPFEGWPYLDAAGEGLKALETVDFVNFKKFIREVERAARDFELLERALPQDDALWLTRAKFYRGCRGWARFMGLKEQLQTSDLTVEVRGDDPVTPPFGQERVEDTAQHYYDAVALDLGLCIKEGDQPCSTDRPLRIPTLTEQRKGVRRTIWKWTTRPGNPELTVALVDGRRREGVSQNYPSLTRTLGQSSPLALCAYLHRYGVRSDDTWVTSHGFDLPGEFVKKGVGHLKGTVDPDKTFVGEKYIFTLERPLPDPIAKLQPASAR